jgi:hypothetical protein
MVNTVQLENGNGTAIANTTAGHDHHFGTRLIHAGSEASEETGAVIPPVSLSTTYKQSAVGVHKVSLPLRSIAGHCGISGAPLVW